MEIVRVAAIQRSSAGSKKHNIEESVRLIEQAVRECPKLDLVVFPEDNNAFEPTREEAYASAETKDGPYISALRDAAVRWRVNVHCGSFTELAGDKTKNTSVVIDRSGAIIGDYSKLHLSDAMGFQESAYVEAGDHLGLIETDFGKLGVIICYDMRFPELARTYALQGADILCVSALWPCGNPLPVRTDHWDVLTRATAISNLSYVVACNQFGPVGGENPFGRSCIVDPWGTVIAQAGEGVQIVYGCLDLEYQKRIRRNVATFENRKPEYYTC